MIGFLKGRIFSIKNNSILLDVAGVGYKLFVPIHHTQKLTKEEEVLFYVKPIYREDDQILFGFLTESELELFEMVIKINGIGPKTGLNLIDYLPGGALGEAIFQEEATLLMKVPGIGKKTAERIIVELKDKLPQIEALSTSSSPHKQKKFSSTISHEVLSALLTLGYNQRSGEQVFAIAKESLPQETSVEEIISFCLNELNKGKR